MRFINQVGCVQRVQRDVCIDISLRGIIAVVPRTIGLHEDTRRGVHGYRAVRVYFNDACGARIDIDRA